MYTCLFAARGHDLRALLRDGQTDAAIARSISGLWAHRDDRYSEIRSSATSKDPKVEMSFIGG
jgi:cyclic pyranopterin phosphate synthase